ACAAVGMTGRIPHDLRRSGVKRYIDAGVDPYTVTRWSGHRTESMLGATTSSTWTTCGAPEESERLPGAQGERHQGRFWENDPNPPEYHGKSRPAATPSSS